MRGNVGQLLSIPDGAVLLGQSEDWLRKRIERRLIPFKKIGSRVYFDRGELEEWLMAATIVSPTEALENAQRMTESNSNAARPA